MEQKAELERQYGAINFQMKVTQAQLQHFVNQAQEIERKLVDIANRPVINTKELQDALKATDESLLPLQS